MGYTFKHGDRPLDGYAIQRAVGAGGFGEVYYAISDGGREVALKYLRDNPAIELRGVSTCMNLKSPHLVSIFDVRKTSEGEYFIVMEYCSGPSLRDLLIAEPAGLGQQKAAYFAREIAKGLAYLHDRGIVHRDLKPGNIFYDDGYVKIGDYGLSKFISVSRHSGQTASVGTVHYMAPEIGSGNYDRGVDIYALGVMLYEMLLGRAPFEGSSMGEVLMKHLTSQPEVDHLPAPFGQVIRRALMKDPRDRYQTVDEMIGDLLQVEDVQRSLAGFSPKSLDGAVRIGAAGGNTPLPSPNPAAGFGLPPRAMPVGGGAVPPPLPERVQRRMDRVSRKVDQRLARLGGRPMPPPLPQAGEPAIGGGAGCRPGGLPPYAQPVDEPRSSLVEVAGMSPVPPLRPRSGLERGVFAVAAIVLMGVSIVAFIAALEEPSYHSSEHVSSIMIVPGWVRSEAISSYNSSEQMALILVCIGSLTAALFAAQKTTACKRAGFWRESLLPFMLSASMFAIGASITVIALANGGMVGGPGLLFPIATLVLSGLAFLVLAPWRLAVAVGGGRAPDRSFILKPEVEIGSPAVNEQLTMNNPQ